MCTNSQDNEKKNESDKTILNSTDRIADKADIDPKLLALLDQVCQSGEDALSALKAYTDETQAENAENAHPDVESALKEFKEQHAAAFATHKHTRVRRWGYRLCVIAAAIIVLNTICIFAFGRSMYDYVAMWGAETFGYIMQTANPEKYDPDTYYNPREQYVDELPETDPNAPLGSEDNPIPLDSLEPDSKFANIPDTDVSALGLEKNESIWDEAHITEHFSILNKELTDVASVFGIPNNLIPTWIPDGFVQNEISVTKDYSSETVNLEGYYSNENEEYLLGIVVRTINDNSAGGVTEKDDRPVIEYCANGVEWYIMHNLEIVTAVTIIDDRHILFFGPITVEEMRKMIDSVYVKE